MPYPAVLVELLYEEIRLIDQERVNRELNGALDEFLKPPVSR